METILQTCNKTDTKKKRANDLYSQYIGGKLPLASSGVFLKQNKDTIMDKDNRDVYFKIVAEKLWSDLACYINYTNTTLFEFMLTKLPLLADPYLYPGYQKYVGSMDADLKSFTEFKSSCKKLFHIKKDRNVYLSVLAYTLSVITSARPMIEALFKRNEKAVLRHMSSEYASREFVKYYLDTTDFYYYRMVLALCLETEHTPALISEIRNIIKKTMPNVKEYVDNMGQYLKDDDFADGFFGPFLFVFQKIYVMRGDVGLILRLILAIYELCQDNGYRINDEEPTFITGMFFVLNSTGGSNASTGANIIISKCKDALKSVSGIRFENEFTSFLDMSAFLINWAGIYVEKDVNNVIAHIKLLPKRRVKSMVENFITTKYILVDLDYKQYNNYTEYVEKNIEDVLSFFQYTYSKWYKQYSYTQKDKIDFFKDCDEKSVELGFERLAHFFNLFIDHARLELYLYDMAQIDYVFEDVEIKQKTQAESEYKKKCLDLEKECRELRNNDTNSKLLMTENAELKKKIEKLNLQISQYSVEREKDKKELVGLRNLVYEFSGNVEPEQVQSKISIEEMGEYLNKDVKGVIIGGHINVHNKLDKYIPKWKKFSPETKISLNAIKNNDIVVMFSDYLNHSSYFRVIDWIRESDCKLLYIHNVNMDYVVNKIYNVCKEE